MYYTLLSLTELVTYLVFDVTITLKKLSHYCKNNQNIKKQNKLSLL